MQVYGVGLAGVIISYKFMVGLAGVTIYGMCLTGVTLYGVGVLQV